MERDDEEERRAAEIVARHLDPSYTAEFDAQPQVQGSTITPNPSSEDQYESSLKLQGGDIHRDIYKISARATPIQRAQTFSHPGRSGPAEIGAVEQREPGGFRRHYVQQQMKKRSTNFASPITNNFVSFLELYGSFAGEDLEESDDETAVESDEEDQLLSGGAGRQGNGERRPLLGRRKTTRGSKQGDASMTRTFFLLIKSFIGTGVLFLPKAFKNGGLVFSLVTLVMISLISCVAFHLLLKCRAKYGGGYGDIAEAIGGKRMRSITLASITLSQLGFVCAGIIFAAENLYSFLEAVIKSGVSPLSITALIGLQLIVLVPLALIRDISKLGGAALLADVFILHGLGYIYAYDISTLATKGMSPSVEMFNPQDFTLTIGSAIFTFEGIGLILPIQSSMKEPQKFEGLLYTVMFIITIIFASVGALSYATFGDKTTVEIISNFPQDSKLVNAVQFLYSLAVLAGDPVQLFPAMRILEGSIFGHRSGKQDVKTKWKKNAFRTLLVCGCGLISILGATNLDKFVALIGSFACVPLVYIYPAYLHWKGIAENKYVKAGDVLLMGVGLVAMVYTTAVTISRWGSS
ncbi:related to AVT3-involved in amino acid efflux from the vacuole [Rhynchosporium graminicola]|uniref:Related to AVT3-involved in amino acid efflux from the vacuole n=1 Tax=Rhynchosporium graminicola TaxID=2792576 RepID=A0A1E1LP85_9HELO|nr:related to AVT3-involved in amino acid efflux from the vacuole [Rhynchosporium commune]